VAAAGPGGGPPDPDTLLAQALVAVDTDPDTGRPARYRLHPGIAEAGRASAGADFTAAVDAETGAYWLAILRHALGNEHEQLGWLVLRAARGTGPYLLRQHAWNGLGWAAEQVLGRDLARAPLPRCSPCSPPAKPPLVPTPNSTWTAAAPTLVPLRGCAPTRPA
jgi:hypothetical protein